MKDIALQEFAQQASNVKLSDVLQRSDEPKAEVEDVKVLETPVRLVDQQVPHSGFIDGTDYEGVFRSVKRGIIVIKETEFE